MKHIHRIRSRRLRQGFTLIELIVVMGIVGILVTGGLIAFMQTAKAGRLGQGREVLSSVVRSARAYAMSNNRNAILVFNTNKSSVHNASLRDERCYRAMALFDPILNDFVTPWESMPGGIFFDPSQNGIMSASNFKKIAYEGQAPSSTSMPWIWIRPDGTLPNGPNDPSYVLKIVEGIPETGSNVFTPRPSGRYKTVRINWLNGSLTTISPTSAGDED